MRNAALIRRNKLFMVHHYAQVRSGYFVVAEPVDTLDVASPPAAIGKAVRRALARCSRSRVPDPDPSLSLDEPIIRAAGVKTRSAFMRRTRLVEVIENAGRILLRPTENHGARQGFSHLPDLDVAVLREVSDEDLGMAALRALELSK